LCRVRTVAQRAVRIAAATAVARAMLNAITARVLLVMNAWWR
jgi:hypothetical protein